MRNKKIVKTIKKFLKEDYSDMDKIILIRCLIKKHFKLKKADKKEVFDCL